MTDPVKVTPTRLDGLLLIEPVSRFQDFRGEYVEYYNRPAFHAAGIMTDFIQDDISVSRKGVLRGLHGDAVTTKLISCHHGQFFLAVVNWDPDSPQYRQWQTFELSAENRLAVLIPPKFINGHYIQTETAIFHYKQDALYDRSGQVTVMYDDPALGIPWPLEGPPILSRRDAGRE
ncbi:dTDP-4-dehydrorhamnose 3,5-epimerase family protein [Magnetospirillum sp. UT-4]|uniref:dTDP-4-dehydrorhamnose 3,5-epimerase family protein n=1 Tax=Magnetospirillum sp. UT-4 TaxID=2681467 RepID=UPI00137D8DC5|nr:dTDP-4-dehydrorhamnose 3,5-epimerase [Magnetospirillum sp. UT-4]CAA7618412.1 dTDP-4-dehydrorhamnose 3,5-epimerase [Magnetospirillum sp. UT-4]